MIYLKAILSLFYTQINKQNRKEFKRNLYTKYKNSTKRSVIIMSVFNKHNLLKQVLIKNNRYIGYSVF